MLRLFSQVLVGIMAAVSTFSNGHAGGDGITDGISGTISVQPDLAVGLASGDRLVLKLYHPDDGVEKDTRYWIIDTFELPRDFEVAPSIDMNGKARWTTYMLEVFTDRDGDVLNDAPGELIARTADLVPLGTGGLQLELTEPDR